jgi:hypothetical protein
MAGIDFNRLYNSANLRFGQSTSIGNIVSILLNYVFPLAGLVFLLMLIAGGFKMMTSGGEPKKVAGAREGLTTGIIGFVIIFISYWLVQIIARVLAIPDIVSIFG